MYHYIDIENAATISKSILEACEDAGYSAESVAAGCIQAAIESVENEEALDELASFLADGGVEFGDDLEFDPDDDTDTTTDADPGDEDDARDDSFAV